jgi:hypothetical protein
MALKILFLFLLVHNVFVPITEDAQKTDTPSQYERSKGFPYTTKLALGQNYPNPVRKTDVTTIPYSVVEEAQASIVLYDASKKEQVLVIDKLSAGAGEVKISGDQLATGSYTYALVINGRIVKKKKMVVVE